MKSAVLLLLCLFWLRPEAFSLDFYYPHHWKILSFCWNFNYENGLRLCDEMYRNDSEALLKTADPPPNSYNDTLCLTLQPRHRYFICVHKLRKNCVPRVWWQLLRDPLRWRAHEENLCKNNDKWKLECLHDNYESFVMCLQSAFEGFNSSRRTNLVDRACIAMRMRNLCYRQITPNCKGHDPEAYFQMKKVETPPACDFYKDNMSMESVDLFSKDVIIDLKCLEEDDHPDNASLDFLSCGNAVHVPSLPFPPAPSLIFLLVLIAIDVMTDGTDVSCWTLGFRRDEHCQD